MLRSLTAAFLITTPCLAGQVSFTANATPLGNDQFVATLPQYDRSLGVLDHVTLAGTGILIGTVSIENTDTQPYDAGCSSGSHGSALIYAVGNVSILGLVQVHCPGYEDNNFCPPVLPAFDGALDFSGPSSATFSPPTNGNTSGQDTFALPTLRDAVSGSGLLSASVNMHAFALFNAVPTLAIQSALGVQVSVSITYHYSDYPARFCFTETASWCPCTGGDAGCANSQNSIGADLISVGNPSLGSDSFGLAAFGMGASTSCMFFQGSSATYAGTLFGDGRRCAGGTIIRLGIKQAAGGSASYPSAQDTPLHIKGKIAQPGTFAAYQVWYRDASPTFCTSSTFNLTSAVASVWTP
jgi:hypothetical protein